MIFKSTDAGVGRNILWRKGKPKTVTRTYGSQDKGVLSRQWSTALNLTQVTGGPPAGASVTGGSVLSLLLADPRHSNSPVSLDEWKSLVWSHVQPSSVSSVMVMLAMGNDRNG